MSGDLERVENAIGSVAEEVRDLADAIRDAARIRAAVSLWPVIFPGAVEPVRKDNATSAGDGYKAQRIAAIITALEKALEQ
jgi:hypothetical protein